MSGQIICHLGPPKTATTSLQVALNSLSNPNFLFAGAFQPRELNVGSLSQRLHDICARGKIECLQTDQVNLKHDLTVHVASGKTVFISEEMFLVHQDGASIEDKVNALKDVVIDLPCQIILTVRDPKFSLPSYFQEIFNSLPFRLQSDFSAFCRDHRAICYDYEELLRIIREAGFTDVKLIDFDLLSAGCIDLGELTSRDEYIGTSLCIEKHNSGNTGRAPTIRKLPSISLKSIGRTHSIQRIVDNLGIRRWSGYPRFASFIDRIVLRKARTTDLRIPSDVAERLDAGYQRIRKQIHKENV